MAENQTPSIVVVGSCMIDLSCFAPRLPMPGETLHGTSFQIGFGGKGANQAVAAAKLGARVEMVARVGDDDYGKNYLKAFKDNNVGCQHVSITAGHNTGIAQITVADNGENQIVIVPGANTKLSSADVCGAADVIRNAKVVVCQLETEPSLVLDAASLVRPAGGQLILNAAPARADISPEILKNIDILCLNETEATMMTNCKVNDVNEANVAITKLLSMGCPMVLLTLGSQGAIFASQSDPIPVHVAAPKVTAVDTTGAGDAFIGALAYYWAYMPTLSMNDIVLRSCQIAAMSVQGKGTQQSFPKREDVPKILFA
ncbi:hypothetical protein B566_EDAN009282 [Ephemera danica]|nr:hypothetical protein B566_EDAN009282 [Ephemera danica]